MDSSKAWEERLSGVSVDIALPLSRRARRENAGIRRSPLDRSVLADLPADPSARCARIVAAVAVLLHRYTAQSGLVVGRMAGAVDAVAPIDLTVAGTDPIEELLDRVTGAGVAADALGTLSAAALRAVRGLAPDDERRPLHAVVVSGDADPRAALALAPLVVEAGSVESITLYTSEALFSAEAAAQYARHLGNVLAALPRGGAIEDVALLSQSEHNRIVFEWNDTTRPVPPRFFHESITLLAQQRPDSIALVHGVATVTFGELESMANRMANHLIGLGVGPGDRIGVCFERGIPAIVAQLAAFKLAAVAVLLDPDYPQERLTFMLADAEVSAVITRSGLQHKVAGEHRLVRADTDSWNTADGAPVWTALDGDTICHIAYTSGSTGQPKAVVLRHGPMRSLVHTLGERCGITHESSGTWLSSPGFGLVEVDPFPLLAAGAVVHIADAEIAASPTLLRDWLVARKVTHSLLLTAMAERLWNMAWPAETALRNVRVAGERVRSWPPAGLPFEVVNVYGAAEVAVVSTANLTALAASLGEDRQDFLPPVGTPIPNVRAYVLDEKLRPVPPGVLGELHVSGANIAANYLNRPEASSRRFIADPVTGHPDRVLYRTGDVARYWPNGVIDIVGRADNEVKVRGYRVHLGEIESLIAAQPGVRQTAVLARRDDDEPELRLVAYVEPDALAPCRPREIRRVLRGKLPRYMRPSAYVFGDLPTTANGKIDRDALPAPEYGRPELDTPYVSPRDDLERLLAGIWQDVLGLDEVGVLDDFFELGGDSLRAVRIIDSLRDNGFHLDLSDLLTASSVAAGARVVERVRRESREITQYRALEHDPANRFAPFPLNQSQQALWIGRGSAVEYGDVGCHGYFEYEHPDLDVDRFRAAWQALLRRHDMLRMVVRPTGEQVILDETPGDGLTVADFSALSIEEATERMTAIREHMSHQVLSHEVWPLYDVRLTRMPGGAVRLHFGLDMLITDAWSIYQVLFPDLIDLYEHPEEELPELEITFRDYVLGKIDALRDSTDYQRAKQYWLDRLPTLPAAPDLPMVAHPRTKPKFHRREHQVPAEIWTGLKDQARALGVTPSVLLVAIFAEVLRTWTSNDRFTINFPVSDRMALHPQVDGLIGDFTNTLLVAVEKVDGTFAERARDIQEQLWRDLAHREFNGVDVLREIARRDGGSLRPVMPVVVTSLLGHPARRQASAFGAETFGISQTPQVTLDFQIREIDGVLHFKWDFLDSLFPEGMIDAMFGAYVGLLDTLIGEPAAWRNEVFDLVPAEQMAQRALVNATDAEVPEALLQELLARQAHARPEKAAVITAERTLRYAELLSAANRIGRKLRDLGARPNQLVGVVMEKGWQQYAAVYGVITSGAAYLPIDATSPVKRLWHLLRSGEVGIVLTQRHLADRLSWPEEIRVLVVDEEFTDFADVDDAPLEPVQQQTDLAYVIYTSGSTGNPKGVMVDHRGVVNHVTDINNRLAIGVGDRAIGTAGLHFDMSVYDVFGILAAGGSVVLPPHYEQPEPDRWALLAQRHDVSFWGAVPALMEAVVIATERMDGAPLTGLRTVVLAGDWIPLTLPERLRALAPEVRVIGSGGPTETVNWSVIYEIGDRDPAWASFPYGKPLSNQHYHIMDDRLRHRPVWATGQMVVGSAVGLAKGYWRDQERTAKQFFFHPGVGERVYATGDMGRYLPDGNIEILGRDDAQVKINGYRVELGEIEATLNRHPDLRAAVVLAPQRSTGGRRLVAFAIPVGEVHTSDLAGYLAERLPKYLVPSDIRLVDSFPLSANGKVDRRAMTELAGTHVVEDDQDQDAAPATALEQLVREFYASTLGVPSVGLDSDFFQLGGDSLSGTRLAGQLSELLGTDVGLRSVLTSTTPRGLAAVIAEDQDTGELAMTMAEVLVNLTDEDLVETEDPAAPAA